MKTIDQILKHARTVAIVGLSPKPGRASLGVAAYLQPQGCRIIPVNPAHAGHQILGENVHASVRVDPVLLGVGLGYRF